MHVSQHYLCLAQYTPFTCRTGISYLYRSHQMVLSVSVISTASSVCGWSSATRASTSLATSHRVHPPFVNKRMVGLSAAAWYTMPLTEPASAPLLKLRTVAARARGRERASAETITGAIRVNSMMTRATGAAETRYHDMNKKTMVPYLTSRTPKHLVYHPLLTCTCIRLCTPNSVRTKVGEEGAHLGTNIRTSICIPLYTVIA